MKLRTIASTSRLSIVGAALTRRPLARPGRRLIRDILYYFFFLQFQTRFRPKIRPVVYVDHPLDRAVPFTPGDVGKYMFFIPLWMKSLGYWCRTRGRDADGQAALFLEGLARVYREAGLIYKTCQSTTRRPAPILHPLFIQIHLLDPHLHCVPSLHVAVVLYNYLKMREMLVRETSPGEAEREIAWCRRTALEIIDTILTVKQHSINCVAAGLYYIHALHPEFTRQECREVIDGLLESRAGEIPELPEIRAYVHDLFSRFLEGHATMEEPKHQRVLLEFLETYRAGEPELKDASDERS